jgi:uncharacterized protein (DUF779 family)
MATELCVTPAAAALIETLRHEHGALIFYLSGGCCEGSAPLCLRSDELRIGPHDILVGEAAGVPFYTSPSHHALLADSRLTLDVGPERGDGFSLESSAGAGFRLDMRPAGDLQKSAGE